MADADAENDDEVHNDSYRDQVQSAVSEPQSQDLREVCLVQQRDARLAFVPCGQQRFCASCVAQLEQQARGCPICRTYGGPQVTTFTQTSSHHTHTTLTLNSCGVGVVSVWCGCGVGVVRAGLGEGCHLLAVTVRMDISMVLRLY